LVIILSHHIKVVIFGIENILKGTVILMRSKHHHLIKIIV